MKRLFFITCSFLVFFAGTAAAWESCRQIAFISEPEPRSPAHTHDHHADDDHEHSGETIAHCPTFSEFLVTATVSVRNEQRVERVPTTLIAEFDSQFARHGSYPLVHGPPGSAQSPAIPRYLSLSVLRI
jgi:hypothetical protein